VCVETVLCSGCRDCVFLCVMVTQWGGIAANECHGSVVGVVTVLCVRVSWLRCGWHGCEWVSRLRSGCRDCVVCVSWLRIGVALLRMSVTVAIVHE
jgi:hypothetical protein